MKQLFILVIFVITIACEPLYYSSVPISENTSTPLDTALFGYWCAKDNEDDTICYLLKITPLENNKAFIDFIEPKGKPMWDKGWNNYVMHSSTINKNDYVNLRVMDGEHKMKYILGRFRIENDTLKTYLLLEGSLNEDFNKSRLLKKHIRNNQQKFNETFDGFISFTRHQIKE